MIVRSLVPCLRASGQERLGFGPNSAHEIGRRLGTGERGALARPSRHSLNVVLSQCGLPHRCGQAALGRIGFRSGGLGRVGRACVVGLNTAAEPTAKSACQNRRLGFEFGQRTGPGSIGLSFGASQESRADLHGAGTQGQRGGDPAAVPDATGCDDRNREFV